MRSERIDAEIAEVLGTRSAIDALRGERGRCQVSDEELDALFMVDAR